MRSAREVVDGADGDEETEVRLCTFLTMVEERGGKHSRTQEKLFSSSEPSPAKDLRSESILSAAAAVIGPGEAADKKKLQKAAAKGEGEGQ